MEFLSQQDTEKIILNFVRRDKGTRIILKKMNKMGGISQLIFKTYYTSIAITALWTGGGIDTLNNGTEPRTQKRTYTIHPPDF